MTSEGLYCPLSDFHIDKKRKVNDAVHKQIHRNHARKKAATYYYATSAILKTCLGKNIVVKTYNHGENFYVNGVQVSFHSTGYILGSAQIHINH